MDKKPQMMICPIPFEKVLKTKNGRMMLGCETIGTLPYGKVVQSANKNVLTICHKDFYFHINITDIVSAILSQEDEDMPNVKKCNAEWNEANCLDKATCPVLSDGSICSHVEYVEPSPAKTHAESTPPDAVLQALPEPDGKGSGTLGCTHPSGKRYTWHLEGFTEENQKG